MKRGSLLRKMHLCECYLRGKTVGGLIGNIISLEQQKMKKWKPEEIKMSKIYLPRKFISFLQR